MLVSLQRIGTGGMRGLRGFDPSGSYAMTANILDMQQDSLVADRVQQIVSGGSVGTYNNRQVYEEPASGSLFVDVGLAYPVLQEIRPQALMTSPPIGGTAPLQPCPCDNCREESVTETYYASKEQQSPNDIPVSMVRDVVICEPSTADGQPTPKCAEDLAKLKAQLGLQGLRGLGMVAPLFSAQKRKCYDSCRGLPQSQQEACLTSCDKKYTSATLPQLGFAYGAQSQGSYAQNILFQGRSAAGGTWRDCYNNCNSQRLSQAELQRCYANCPTTGIVAPTANTSMYLAPNLSTMSGLSNDSTVVDDPSLYTSDAQSQLYLPAPVPCESGNNTLWFLIIGGACTLLGYIIAVALKKR